MTFRARHFKEAEFACKCGCGLAYVNDLLVYKLDEMRDRLRMPVTITSGVRCESYNRRVEGTPLSYHVPREFGGSRAADISVPGLELMHLFEAIVYYGGFTGIGIYPHQNFLHLDLRDGSGGEARWLAVKGTDGKRLYVPWTGDTFKRMAYGE
jgi:uncharacterized protein YcbK (DUF882 family)